MNTRLAFSRAGYLRRIAMSYKTKLFVVVEGKEHDRYFVDRLCRSSTQIGRENYEISVVNQINHGNGVNTGGKAAVLALYDYCRRAHKLVQQNSGGRRSICFLVDRDTQHLTGGKRRSPHVVYTILADTEAHIFANSNEVEAIATAASLDLATAQDVVKNIGDWRRDLADAWRPWIEECYVAEAVRARCWVGFGQASSRIHTGRKCRSLDGVALENARKAIVDSSLITGVQFTAQRQKIMLKLDRIYSAGLQSTLLKGKWLPAHIAIAVEEYFQNIGWSDGWNKNSFKASITRCYLAHLDTSAQELSQLRKSLEALV